MIERRRPGNSQTVSLLCLSLDNHAPRVWLKKSPHCLKLKRSKGTFVLFPVTVLVLRDTSKNKCISQNNILQWAQAKKGNEFGRLQDWYHWTDPYENLCRSSFNKYLKILFSSLHCKLYPIVVICNLQRVVKNLKRPLLQFLPWECSKLSDFFKDFESFLLFQENWLM